MSTEKMRSIIDMVKQWDSDISEDNRRVRAIEPKTLDALLNIQNYGRQVKAVKKQSDNKLRRERQAAKKADTEKRRETDPEFNTYIHVYMLPIAVKAIRYWRASKNEEWIQKVARSWLTKKSWPKEILDAIYNDPNWKANVVRAFELADDLLRLKDMPPPNMHGRATGRLALTRVGVDPDEPMEVYRNLSDIVKKVLARHNIDKHGRRLPQ